MWMVPQAALLAEVIDAWLQGAASQRGLFSRSNDPVNAKDTAVGDPERGGTEDHMEYCADGTSHHSKGGESSRAARVVEHVRAQAVWLGFLEEMWQVGRITYYLCHISIFRALGLRVDECLPVRNALSRPSSNRLVGLQVSISSQTCW